LAGSRKSEAGSSPSSLMTKFEIKRNDFDFYYLTQPPSSSPKPPTSSHRLEGSSPSSLMTKFEIKRNDFDFYYLTQPPSSSPQLPYLIT